MHDRSTAETVFFAALEKGPPAERAAYLDEACAGDSALRRRVDALLAAQSQVGGFLEQPVVAAGEAMDGVEDAAAERSFLTPSARPDSLGRIGHYEVLQVLGQGGFGIVFRAFDDTLQRVVAVKVMAPQLAATSPARKRFLREARSAAAVRHENVVQVYEVGEQPLPYLAMEFIPGETLQQRLDRTGPLDVPEVVRVGRQIAEGLAAAHMCDLIHRDIKPANVLIEGGRQRVKITDFGLARAADDASISQSGIIAGTPMYMAPEQALGHRIDRRADLFSLGSVLYQMAAGRPPFRAVGTLAVLKRVAEDDPRPIREIIPETPPWLCAIIAKLHAKNPDDRFQTARDVADVLADCEAQLKAGSKLKDFSRIPRGPRPLARASKRVATAAAVLLPVVALAMTEAAGVTHLIRSRQSTADAVNPGDRVAETLPPTFTNGFGMEFVIVPKGKSWLGGEKDKLGDREVNIPADFYLGKYEVTQEEWTQVMGDNPSHFSWTRRGVDAVKDIPDADLKRFPVDQASWDDCQLFVAKLNSREKETGWTHRLPTEAEWEYACRGGPMADKADSAFNFYFAKPTNTLGPDQANFKAGLNRTCKVGSYEANRLGLFDMHGNAWEWCDDIQEGADKNPVRALRGGSWQNHPIECRVMTRHAPPRSYRGTICGVRLARVPSGAPAPEPKTPPRAVAPFTDADARRVAALPAAEQVEEVRKALEERNPGFDGAVAPTIENDAVTGLKFTTDRVTDISPVRALARLRTLHIQGSDTGKGSLADLSPLKGMSLSALFGRCNKVSDLAPLAGMPLERLDLWQWYGTDLTPLRGMPLTWLNCGGSEQKLDLTPLAGLPLEYLCVNFTQVSDLSPLKDVPLTELECQFTLVSDLAPLRDKQMKLLWLAKSKVSDLAATQGMPLEDLTIGGTPVTDLSPLMDVPLKRFMCDFQAARDAKTLRAIKTLETINGQPAAEFWKDVNDE